MEYDGQLGWQNTTTATGLNTLVPCQYAHMTDTARLFRASVFRRRSSIRAWWWPGGWKDEGRRVEVRREELERGEEESEKECEKSSGGKISDSRRPEGKSCEIALV